MTMLEKDRNVDGKVDLKEFLGDIGENIESEWYTVEKNRFEDEYDVDKNGFLEGDEITRWLVPDMHETAKQARAHLRSCFSFSFCSKLIVDVGNVSVMHCCTVTRMTQALFKFTCLKSTLLRQPLLPSRDCVSQIIS